MVPDISILVFIFQIPGAGPLQETSTQNRCSRGTLPHQQNGNRFRVWGWAAFKREGFIPNSAQRTVTCYCLNLKIIFFQKNYIFVIFLVLFDKTWVLQMHKPLLGFKVPTYYITSLENLNMTRRSGVLVD